MKRPSPWIRRSFRFAASPAHHPALLARLEATPARLELLTRSVPAGLLTRRLDGGWSIQEHAGHLIDLEALMDRRLSEFLAGAEVLTAADMSNRATYEAGYNDAPLETILARFRSVRGALVARVRALAPADFARSARHPRLDVPMRVIDWMEFSAEHDDHHLATIAALASKG